MQLSGLSHPSPTDNLCAATAGPRVTGHAGARPLCWRGAPGARLAPSPPAGTRSVPAGQLQPAAGPPPSHSSSCHFLPGLQTARPVAQRAPGHRSLPPPARLPRCPRAAPFPWAASPLRHRSSRRSRPQRRLLPSGGTRDGGGARRRAARRRDAELRRGGRRAARLRQPPCPPHPPPAAARSAGGSSPLPSLCGPRKEAESSARRKFGGSSESNSAAVTAVASSAGLGVRFGVFFLFVCWFVLCFFFFPTIQLPQTHKQPTTTTTTKSAGRGRERERGKQHPRRGARVSSRRHGPHRRGSQCNCSSSSSSTLSSVPTSAAVRGPLPLPRADL